MAFLSLYAFTHETSLRVCDKIVKISKQTLATARFVMWQDVNDEKDLCDNLPVLVAKWHVLMVESLKFVQNSKPYLDVE